MVSVIAMLSFLVAFKLVQTFQKSNRYFCEEGLLPRLGDLELGRAILLGDAIRK